MLKTHLYYFILIGILSLAACKGDKKKKDPGQQCPAGEVSQDGVCLALCSDYCDEAGKLCIDGVCQAGCEAGCEGGVRSGDSTLRGCQKQRMAWVGRVASDFDFPCMLRASCAFLCELAPGLPAGRVLEYQYVIVPAVLLRGRAGRPWQPNYASLVRAAAA